MMRQRYNPPFPRCHHNDAPTAQHPSCPRRGREVQPHHSRSVTTMMRQALPHHSRGVDARFNPHHPRECHHHDVPTAQPSSAQGETLGYPQRRQHTDHPRALKGRSSTPRPHPRQRCPVSRVVLSGLWPLGVSVIAVGPRALPWAEVGRAVGTWPMGSAHHGGATNPL